MTTTTLQARSVLSSLTVNDLARSTRLYTEGLGFTLQEEYKMEGKVVGVMLASGDSGLMLTQDDFAKGKDRVKGIGMRLYLETDQDLQALARQAKAAGLSVEGDPAPLGWGPMGFSLTDPDGFKVTVSGPNN
jgi:Predicted lactoylglutathione lyase